MSTATTDLRDRVNTTVDDARARCLDERLTADEYAYVQNLCDAARSALDVCRPRDAEALLDLANAVDVEVLKREHHPAKVGPRTGAGAYHVVRWSDEHGMEISIGLVYKDGDGWVASGRDDRITGLCTRAAAVEAADTLDRTKQEA